MVIVESHLVRNSGIRASRTHLSSVSDPSTHHEIGMVKVLFVCLGNICRSPLAEAILNKLLADQNVKGWTVDSAATSRYEIGCSPDHRGLRLMKRKGLTSTHRARQIITDDFDKFDYILCMDDNNVRDVRRMAPKREFPAKIELLGRYDEEGPDIIEDPYYGGDRDFEVVYDQCLRACTKFICKVSD